MKRDRNVVIGLLAVAYLIGVVGLVYTYNVISVAFTLIGLAGIFAGLLSVAWGFLAVTEYLAGE